MKAMLRPTLAPFFPSMSFGLRDSIEYAGLMTDDLLSKRTDVYVQGVYQKAAGPSTHSVLDQALIAGAQGVSSNAKQFVARVAMRHAF